MPKIKDPALNLIDAQTNLSVFRSKMERSSCDFALEQVSTILALLKTLIKDYNINIHGSARSVKDLLIDNKGNKPQSVRAENIMLDRIYESTSMEDAVNVGLSYNIPQKELASLIKRAPYNTPVGKLMMKINQKAVLKDLPIQHDNTIATTNNSDNHTPVTEDDDVIMDEDLMKQLSSK